MYRVQVRQSAGLGREAGFSLSLPSAALTQHIYKSRYMRHWIMWLKVLERGLEFAEGRLYRSRSFRKQRYPVWLTVAKVMPQSHLHHIEIVPLMLRTHTSPSLRIICVSCFGWCCTRVFYHSWTLPVTVSLLNKGITIAHMLSAYH